MKERALVAPEQQKKELGAESKRLNVKAVRFLKGGWMAGIGSAIFLVVSKRRDEPISRAGLIFLLGFYVLLQFGAV